jgi:V/A-type H+-transporting ATPase subunit I
MKKATIIVCQKDADATVKNLRSLGVLHIEHQEAPQSREINLLQEEMSLLNSCMDVFAQEDVSGVKQESDQTLSDWQTLARHVVELWKRYDQLESYSHRLTSDISAWEPWGDFNPHSIRFAQLKGLYIRLYKIPVKQLGLFPKGVIVKTISVQAGIAYILVVSREDFSSPFKEITLPKQSLIGMRKRLAEDKKAMQEIKNEIIKATKFIPQLLENQKKLEKEMELQQALAGMAKNGPLTYILGYLPVDTAQRLAQEAKRNKWGLLVRDPEEEDNIPTLIRNPRWISLISPLFKFLEILPGYRELDISLPFLIFFSIFFGMLIGDAGYGLVYMVITFLFHQKAKGKKVNTSNFFLFYILSLCAIIWGIFTGTFFGQEWVLRAGYKPLIPALNDEKSIQRFCFLLGAIHLSLAHSWRAALKFPTLVFLADVGWICILWAAFFTANTLILSDAFPFFGKWLIITGITLVIFFTNPQRKILKGIGKGLGTLALSLMNNFTDVISYVRLFAVGLAGVAIADAFNSMAGLVGRDNVFAIIVSVLIVIIGHTLGVVLGPVSVLVHGVRLNVLEFSGHANVSWGGQPYKPLKE